MAEHFALALKRRLTGAYLKLMVWLTLPIVFAEFFRRETGREYGVGLRAKIALVLKMARNNTRIPSASSWQEHLAIATSILQIPRSVEGCVVECGCYKGGSAANLSLVCALTRRQLVLFDSFQGLPRPSNGDAVHALVGTPDVATYREGDFAGSLQEVKDSIAGWGRLDVCRFHAGFFQDTLPAFHRPCALIFVDVDLRRSLRTCLIHLWPLLQVGCCLFTHEAHDFEVSSLFFDRAFWRLKLRSDPPGLVGVGSVVGFVSAAGSLNKELGYTVKRASSPAPKGSSRLGATGAANGRARALGRSEAGRSRA